MTKLSRPPTVAAQVTVGFAVGVLAAVAEAIVCVARDEGQTAGPVELVSGALHVGAMYLPLTVAAGLAIGLCLSAVGALPLAAAVGRRLRSPRALFSRDPEAFASGLAAVVAAAGLVVATRTAALHFATRYHDAELSAWAMAATVLGLSLGSFAVYAVLRRGLAPVASAVGPLASAGAVVIVVLAGAVLAVAGAWVFLPQLFEAYDELALFWLPGMAVAWSILALLLGAVSRRRGWSPRTHRSLAAAAIALTVAALALTAITYGGSNRVRTVVEERAIAGRRLVRFWAGLGDRDGDGHSFAFGGGDCDDGDARVHPGAADPEGDGVDADCFDGDGARNVADMGNGAYGRVPASLRRPNVLLVTIDTLRADHVGCYGYPRETTPRIDGLCAEATRFDQATTQSSRSLRSFASLFTGAYPSQIGFGPEYLFPTLLDENTTIAEALASGGYDTGAIVGSDYFTRARDLTQGFRTVYQDPEWRPPRARAVDRALPRLRQMAEGGRPFFLWVHLMNVHARYLEDGHPSRFGTEPVDMYDEEIALADAEVGRLLDALVELGVDERTVVVVASDHGEGFGEHGNWFHAFNLYEEETRVALIVRLPGVAPLSIDQPVGLIDVFPTLTNLAGVPLAKPLPSRSLLPLATGTGRHPEGRYLFSEIMPEGSNPTDVKAVRQRHRKLIWWVHDGRFSLFDLQTDPGERHDLSDERRDEAEELLAFCAHG